MADSSLSIFQTTEVDKTMENLNGMTNSTTIGDVSDLGTFTPSMQISTANIVFITIGVLAILGNALVIFIGTKSSAMRQLQSNLLILSQSGIDLVTGLCMIMYYIPFYKTITYSVFNMLLCKFIISGFAVDATVLSSTYNLLLITFERYLMVIHPITHRNWFTESKIKMLVAVALLLGPVVPMIILVKADIVEGVCQGYLLLSRVELIIILYLNVFLVVVVPIIINVYAYTTIFIRLRKQRKEHQNKQQKAKNSRKAAEMNTLKTMCIVGVCYCFCHFPGMISIFMFFINDNPTELQVTIISITLAFSYCNSAINPFIYAFKHERFKKELKKYFLCKRLRGVGTSSVAPDTMSKPQSDGGTNTAI